MKQSKFTLAFVEPLWILIESELKTLLEGAIHKLHMLE